VTVQDGRGSVDLPDLRQQAGETGSRGGFCAKIRLGQHDTIRKRHLLHAFEVPLHRLFDHGHVDCADDAGQSKASCHDMVPIPDRRKAARCDLIDDRSGIGKPGRLDDHALERRDSLALHSVVKFEQGRPDVAGSCAAEAACRCHHQLALVHANKVMIDGYIAKLVDDDGGVRKGLARQELIEQRGFPRA
jgi:hypothetical protein